MICVMIVEYNDKNKTAIQHSLNTYYLKIYIYYYCVENA